MLINLHRSFHFDDDQKKYDVDYFFTKETVKAGVNTDLCLELNVSIDNAKRKTHKLTKGFSTLHQSNEVIEKMIKEETVSFFNQ